MKANTTPAPASPAQPYHDQLPTGANFARWIRRLRKRLWFTLDAFAKAAHVSRTMIYYVEHRKRRPTLDMAARLSRACGLELRVMPLRRRAPRPPRRSAR
ncbi:MAG: helix-turn-helix transcriptional regulator [Verrucomicrobia bacterium]|nr:helix-turn-helix transcriptional regulator [Verrucomicrobiota bacterium]